MCVCFIFSFFYVNFHLDDWTDLRYYGTVKLLVKTEEKQECPKTIDGLNLFSSQLEANQNMTLSANVIITI